MGPLGAWVRLNWWMDQDVKNNEPAMYSWRSVPHMPHHSTETRTWLVSRPEGEGAATSTTRRSLRPKNCTAFMIVHVDCRTLNKTVEARIHL